MTKAETLFREEDRLQAAVAAERERCAGIIRAVEAEIYDRLMEEGGETVTALVLEPLHRFVAKKLHETTSPSTTSSD